jgi:uncharacterized DUF497 family protein
MGDFDWDDVNRDHIARHGATPDEAEQVYWNDPLYLGWDEREGEIRYNCIGKTRKGPDSVGRNNTPARIHSSGYLLRAGKVTSP